MIIYFNGQSKTESFVFNQQKLPILSDILVQIIYFAFFFFGLKSNAYQKGVCHIQKHVDFLCISKSSVMRLILNK